MVVVVLVEDSPFLDRASGMRWSTRSGRSAAADEVGKFLIVASRRKFGLLHDSVRRRVLVTSSSRMAANSAPPSAVVGSRIGSGSPSTMMRASGPTGEG